MKIQILSDLHLEFSHYKVKLVKEADALVIAGDYTVAKFLWELESFAGYVRKPIVFVVGNHDYYYGSFDQANEKLEQIDSDLSNFHFLNNSSIVIGEVKFIGSTLWSNFDLAPDPKHFAQMAKYAISDFDLIDKTSTQKFSPEDCWKLNEESRRFLKDEINASFNGRIVVVTHFFPHPKSIHPKYGDHSLNPYFCCNCEDLMSSNVHLWIHGHTHESIDYFHKGARVIANPRGYYSENTSFNEKLVVEV